MERPGRIAAVAAGSCGVGFVGVYLLFVWTWAGQALDFNVLQGAPALLETADVLRARSWLSYITVYAVAGVVVLVLAIGLLRRRPALAVAGAAVIGVTAVLERVLGDWVLVRPSIIDDPINHGNSFPSGHVAIAMSALFGLLIVVPYAWRGWVALLGSVYVVGVAEMTMTVGWHRLSDAIGGNLLALGVACLALAVLARRDGARTQKLRLSLVAIVPLLGYVVWTVAKGVGPAYGVLSSDKDGFQSSIFQAAGATATVASALTVVAFLVVSEKCCPGNTFHSRA